MTTHIICGSFGISDVAVEIDAKSRFIFQRANPATDTFPGVDHSVANDVFELTEQHITDIGPIALCIRASPCGDFCKLRLFLADGTIQLTTILTPDQVWMARRVASFANT